MEQASDATVPEPARATPFSGRTAWARSIQTPLRDFLRTETGGAAILLAAAIAALVWANVDAESYERVWSTILSIDLGGHGISLDLRQWVNSGLMTLFFFVIGLEARREFDLGELRERRRFVLPLLAALAGIAVPITIYVLINAGSTSVGGWGVAMSTDTAFALGALALVGPRFPDRLRAFMLTMSVVDDIVALAVIATVYTEHFEASWLLVGIGVFALLLVLMRVGLSRGIICLVSGVVAWIAVLESGVEPIVVGLAMGLLTFATPAARTDLERATELFRRFREQPTPELAFEAQAGVRSTISPNERLQRRLHPWTSYLIVPVFALANAGVTIDQGTLRDAFTSPITLGILFGYVAGKPLGILGCTYIATRLTGGRIRPPVGWASVAGGGTVAGIGFTVALLVASLAFEATELEHAKIGILASALAATALTWLLFRATALLPRGLRITALSGGAEPITDLYADVDVERDHVRGPADAPVTLVEYGDFQCPYCGMAEPVVRALLADFGDVRYVWRHLPLNDVHRNAQNAAEASEAAADQGKFWEMHDLLLHHQDALTPMDLMGYAEQLGLDVERFTGALQTQSGATRIAEDVDSADLSGVSGTPTFFVNGRRHYGAYDIATLTAAVREARVRAELGR